MEYDYWRLQTNRDFLREEVYDSGLDKDEVISGWMQVDTDRIDIDADE